MFSDGLVVSALQGTGGYVISRQNSLELHLGSHACLLSYFYIGLPVVRMDGRASVQSRDYQIFWDG